MRKHLNDSLHKFISVKLKKENERRVKIVYFSGEGGKNLAIKINEELFKKLVTQYGNSISMKHLKISLLKKRGLHV